MKITDVLSLPEKENPHRVSVRAAYKNEHATVMHVELKPGEALKRHITPVDVFFYVLEGNGTVEVGDEQKDVGRDMLVESPAGIPHCLSNNSDGVFRVLVVKVPTPTTGTKLL